MLPEIKDLSPLPMANDPAGSVGSSGLRKASSGVPSGLNIATMAKRRQPIGVDGGTLRPRLARDGGRGHRPVRRADSDLRNARRSLSLLADGRERRAFRRAASLLDLRAAPKVALKEPAIA
jgi:hypothetical protein